MYGNPDGFYLKSMLKMLPLMKAVRAEGDLSNLLSGAAKHSGLFTCPDSVVTFKLAAKKNT